MPNNASEIPAENQPTEINDFSSKNNKFALGEATFKSTISFVGISIIALLAGIFITLLLRSSLSMKDFGFSFLWKTTWDPVTGEFGALPFLVGTLLTSFLAILISTPFSLAIAVLLGEYLRRGIFPATIRSVIELLAGIPSVIYGFWGIFFLVPIVQKIEMELGIIPDGVGILTASIILAIMIVPYSASIAREVISMVPAEQKEAAYSLGSTRYEVIRSIIIPYARSGIFAGIILALGRALGETMAVTMVIGNRNSLPHEIIINPDGLLGTMSSWAEGFGAVLSHLAPAIASIFGGSNTMASVIANEFTEATNELYIASLIEIGLALFIVSTIINVIGKETIRRLNKFS